MTEFTDFFNKTISELKSKYESGTRVYPHLIVVKGKTRLWFNLKNAPSYMSPMDAVYPLVVGFQADMFVMFSEVWAKFVYTKEEMLGAKNLRYGDISRFSDRVECFVIHGASLSGEKADEMFYILTEGKRVKGLKQDQEQAKVSSSKIPYAVNGKWIEFENIHGYDFDAMAKLMESESK